MIAVFRLHGLCCGRLLQRVDANKFSCPALVFKLHYAVEQREESIVFTSPDILPGFPLRPSLPRDNIAATDVFTAKLF
jgi:hypothetical protein